MDIYPNPVIDELTIDQGSKQVLTSYRVHNSIGQELTNGKLGTGTTQINLSALPEGAYILSLYTEEGIFRQSKSLIKISE